MNGRVRPVGMLVPPVTADATGSLRPGKPAQPATRVAMSAGRPGRQSDAPYWLAIIGALVAAAGLGALATTRRLASSPQPVTGPERAEPEPAHRKPPKAWH